MQNEDKNVVFAAIDEMMPLITEAINSGKSVELSPRGTSMLPMLREGKDSVILSAPQGELKKYDIPLYRRKDGTYALHRVIAIGDYSYVCIGDNQYFAETVYHHQVIAVVTAFKKNGRLLTVDNRRYRIYVALRMYMRPARYFLIRVKRKIKRILGINK